MTVTIWHNPRCSKSRETLALVEKRFPDETIEIRRYLDDPPSKEEIEEAIEQLGLDSVRGLARTKEALFKELSLTDATDPELVNALADHPKLIERPVVFFNGSAVIGRPPQNVDLLIS